ncbi:TPA: sodium:proton antiporter [Clostridioides difficile]|uniref:cation:proton antiporter n=1 Tax=Clostridioides difficile TaxID=1496 RepID=UPI0009800291|nr:sodium:proton antiporter [Clostridioides difficile]MCI9906108.1 sodium:proton antiporter [Clostridioides difficile]MCO8868820.1 sodium:proton antiporter [Clostridioides difficile]MCO8996646.1 sodium:proton antiporter [Clostridioides difficile]MCO9001281.1 sodium:proton antiporter [Clostridioides difficile]SJQ03326.1 Sodium, potassium, lithium and rubidium/H(+) antiporter [Clostridioides difficile]
MSILVTLLGLLVCTTISTVFSKKWSNIPLAIYQIVLGIILSILPFKFSFSFNPEIFVICIIAPLLFSEGQNVSRKELLELRKPILLLAFGLVLITVFAGGIFIHFLIPGMPLAVSFALAAVISPTDLVAVKSITQGLNFPKNMMSILEGESLLNDAAGVVAFKVAVLATVTGVFSIEEAGIQFMITAFGGIIVGSILGYIIIKIRLSLHKWNLEEIPMVIVIQIMTPLFVYFVAEEIGVSGILAVVMAGIAHGIEKEHLQNTTTKLRIISDNTWYVLEYVLNGFVFTLLGFLLPSIYTGLSSKNENMALELTFISTLIVLILFVIRFIWVYLWHNSFIKPKKNPLNNFFVGFLGFKDEEVVKESISKCKYSLIVATCGVHGTFTLATALSIPFYLADKDVFPMRDTVLFISSEVILISLVLATVLLPRLLKNNVQESEPLLSDKEAYKLILKEAILKLSNEKAQEVQPVIHDLNEQLVDSEKGILNTPDNKLISMMIAEADQKGLLAVLKLLEDGKISDRAFKLYRFYITKSRKSVQKSIFKIVKLKISMWIINRKVKKEVKEKITKIVSENKEIIKEFHHAYALSTKTAISFINKNTDEDNRHEALIAIRFYNRYLNWITRKIQNDDKFEARVEYYRVMAIQSQRDSVQQLVETKQISREVAKELLENILYDEMMMIES